MPVIDAPQRILHLISTWHRVKSPKGPSITYMMIGIKIDGRNFLSRMFVKGSNTAYETKKMVSDELYMELVNPRSLFRPAIFAFPMLVLSRKAKR